MGKKINETINDTSVKLTHSDAENYYTLLDIEREKKSSNKYKVVLFVILFLLASAGLTAVIVTLAGYTPYVDPDGEDFDMYTVESSEVGLTFRNITSKNSLNPLCLGQRQQASV